MNLGKNIIRFLSILDSEQSGKIYDSNYGAVKIRKVIVESLPIEVSTDFEQIIYLQSNQPYYK